MIVALAILIIIASTALIVWAGRGLAQMRVDFLDLPNQEGVEDAAS